MQCKCMNMPHSLPSTITTTSSAHCNYRAPALFRCRPSVGLNTVALINCQPWSSSRRMGEVTATRCQLPEMEKSKAILRKRKVVEHVAVFQMKKDFTEEQEKDMLDHLFTLQYQMRGIISVSLGRINGENSAGCTHGLLTRFPSVEALNAYYDSPIRWRIEHEYIIPHYHGLICVDYETEVEDDIIPVFRRGEVTFSLAFRKWSAAVFPFYMDVGFCLDPFVRMCQVFEQGVEHLMLLHVKEGISSSVVQEALQALSGLNDELGSLVVQHTSGTNFCALSKGYTHGMVTRFPSEEAKEIFTQHPAYLEILGTKFLPISNKILSLGFDVAPIGTTPL